MDKVFILQHENSKTEDVKFIGVFRTCERAEAATRQLLPLLGFKRYPEGFSIDEYRLDQVHWDSGFGPPDDEHVKDDEESLTSWRGYVPNNIWRANVDPRNRVAPLEIRLLFLHPTIDPQRISDTLMLEPMGSARVGETRVGLNGEPFPEPERESSWQFVGRYYEEPKMEVHFAELLANLKPHASFIRQILAEGGRASVILSFPGQRYFGDQIDAPLLADMGELGLTLGIEIFPDSAT